MHLPRLRDLRQDHDLRQLDVAELLHISRSQYNLYENGKRDIPVDLLCVLSKHYKVSLDYIVEHTDVQDRYPEPKKNKFK